MAQYLIRRLIQSIFTLFVISLLIFTLVNLVPGGMMAAYEENADFTPEDIARMREKFGLDDPIPVRYAKWAGNLIQGNWGNSFVSKRPVLVEIWDRLGNTVLLMGTMLVVTMLIAIPLGILTALKQYSWFDQIATTLAFAGQSLPTFWFGLILIIIFHVTLRGPDGKPLLPGSGMATLGMPFSLGDRIAHLVLPVAMLALITAAGYMRYLRSSMLEVINQDYIRTARAKGAGERIVIYRHAVRNALIPLVTLLALEIPALFGGALFTETIFAWPGIGRLYYTSALKADYPVVMGLLMINTALILFSNLLVDVLYTWLDPRIRLS